MITAKYINNVKIDKPVFKNQSTKPIKGYNLCKELYANIFLVAKKKSGKTNIIKRMIREFADNKTTVIAFASTLYKDELWLQIQEYCEKHDINFIGHTEIRENGIDHIKDLLDALQLEAQQEQEEAKKPKGKKAKSLILCDDDTDSEEEKEKPSKFQTPKYILVFDDISEELKSPSLVGLLKRNRHYLCKTIISSQYVLDLKPESRKQIDLWLLFKGLNEEKLEDTYKCMDISIDYETFKKLYVTSTEKPFSFFYVDTRHDDYRQNFNLGYHIEAK